MKGKGNPLMENQIPNLRGIESMTDSKSEAFNLGKRMLTRGQLKRMLRDSREHIDDLYKQSPICGKQTDRGKLILIDEGELQNSCTKSRKRKRNASHCTCPRQRAKTEEPALPEGYGYLPDAPYVDKNGHYSPEFTDRVAYMHCTRCDVSGDHWDPFCRNPIYDPPEKEGGTPNPYSWKYILRNFNVDEYLEKYDPSQGKLRSPCKKDSVPQKCIYCRNQTRAKTEEPALPEGYGYLPDAPYVDKNGHYSPEFTDRVAYMHCTRCDVSGDHWDPFCRNPIYDPPEKGGTPNPYSWKYIMRNFNVDEYLEKHDLSQVKPDVIYRRVVNINCKGRLPREVASRLACRILFGP